MGLVSSTLAFVSRPNEMPDDVDLNRHKGTILLIRVLGFILFFNSVLVLGIGGQTGAYLSGTNLLQARCGPWFGGINGFFNSIYALTRTNSLLQIRRLLGMGFFGLIVALAACITAGITASTWAPVSSCAQITNPSNFSTPTFGYRGSMSGGYGVTAYGPSSYQGFAYQCMENSIKKQDPITAIVNDDNLNFDQNTCYCAADTVGTCVNAQIRWFVVQESHNCGSILFNYIPLLQTSVALLAMECALIVLMTWQVASIVYGPTTPLAQSVKAAADANDQL